MEMLTHLNAVRTSPGFYAQFEKSNKIYFKNKKGIGTIGDRGNNSSDSVSFL